jgi:hypothetical protein
MGDACSSSAPATPDALRARVRVPYLRKASAWAAVVWFPVPCVSLLRRVAARDAVRCTRARLVAYAESGNKSVATVVGFAASNTKASHPKSEITNIGEVLYDSVACPLRMRIFRTPRIKPDVNGYLHLNGIGHELYHLTVSRVLAAPGSPSFPVRAIRGQRLATDSPEHAKRCIARGFAMLLGLSRLVMHE